MIRQPFKARTPEELIALLSAVATAILAVIIIMMLYFGREIIIPIALAILLSFVLAPLVGLLQRMRVPRGLAVVSVVIIAFALIFAMGSLLATQLTQLAGDLPRYQSTISEKIQSFRDTTAGRGTLERASGMLKDLSKELDKPKEAATALGAGASPKAAPPKPVPVEVRQPDPGALESLQSLISPLLHPLATTGIIVIFVIFILLQREDLRNRLIRLAGSHDLQRTTAALDDAASRLSRLFLIQLLLNGSFGIVIGIGPLADRRSKRDPVGHPGSECCASYLTSARLSLLRFRWRSRSPSIPPGPCCSGPSRCFWSSSRSSAM